MKYAVACALVALATANSPQQIASDGDNLIVRARRDVRVTREVEVDIATTLAELQSVTIPAIAANAAIDAREAAFNATLTAMRDMTSQINNVAGQVNQVQANVEGRLSTFQATISTAMSATAEANEAAQNSIMSMVDAAISNQTAAAQLQAEALDTALEAALTIADGRINATIALVASKRDGRTYMWSGGCNSHRGGGWQEYCLNQAHIAKSMPKFQVNPSNVNRFIARTAGFYHINYWVASRYSGWAYHCIYVGGRRRTHGYMRQGYHESGNSWRDLHQDLTWPVAAGQEFWGQTYAGSWYAAHSTNPSGEHSRITVVWQGEWDGR